MTSLVWIDWASAYDVGGMVNVIIAPDIYARDRVALYGVYVLIEGVLQRDHGAINVVVQRISTV
jgi:hypothetical protein